MTKDKINIDNIEFFVYSLNTLIIGSGAAALNAANQLYDKGIYDIAIVTDKYGGGTSYNSGSDKQTYYKQSLSLKNDSVLQMAEDLFNGRCMHGDIALIEAQYSVPAFYNLVRLGVPFPKDEYGVYHGYKTDHDDSERATSAGPLTSKFMVEALLKETKKNNITIFDNNQLIDLIKDNNSNPGKVIGAVTLNKSNLNSDNFGFTIFNCINIIIATGGPGGIYRDSVYPPDQTGATGIALESGAAANNLTESQFGLSSVEPRWNVSGSYQQVIPRYVSTDIHGDDEKEFLNNYIPDRNKLLSLIFLKGYQWPFDPVKLKNKGSSLIDILVYNETINKHRKVFLDFTKNPFLLDVKDFFECLDEQSYNYLNNSSALAPTPYQRLLVLNKPAVEFYKSHGIDLSTDKLEIAVCAQHNNGGLKASIWWESNLKHLFPVGEINGTHGVYRSGGASLNSGQVGGIRASEFIAAKYNNKNRSISSFITAAKTQITNLMIRTNNSINPAGKNNCNSINKTIRQKMSETAGIIRNKHSVKDLLADIYNIYKNINELSVKNTKELTDLFNTRNNIICSYFILRSIYEYINKEGKSRGSYIISDDRLTPEIADNIEIYTESDFTLNHILEIKLINHKLMTEWVNIRQIPNPEMNFEKMWKNYRDGNIFNSETKM